MLLPLELVDHIFSFLRQDIPALNACSKAHPSYLSLAERQLYTDIVIQLFDPSGVSVLYDQLSNNAHILYYPRTLKIIGVIPLVISPPMISIVSIIPRMVNLFSFCLYGPGHSRNGRPSNEFISTLRDSLQQTSIQQICFHNLLYLPDYSTTNEDGSVSYSRLVHPLDALVMSGLYNQDIRSWGTHQITHLRSLPNTITQSSLSPFAKLLPACSNSLTSLHINASHFCQGVYTYHPDGHLLDHRFDDDELQDFPFTLSALVCLKKLSIFTTISSISDTNSTEIHSSLPAIIRLIQTAPSVTHVILNVHYSFFPGPAIIGRLDWSPLCHLQSEVFGVQFPRIDVYVSGEGMHFSISDESVLDALAENQVLMDLVNHGVVALELGKGQLGTFEIVIK